jgi:hypothetical protein
MYGYRAYESSWASRNGGSAVKENGTMGRHTSASPPPLTIGEAAGKRRPIRDRLQNITSAMSWIREELVSHSSRADSPAEGFEVAHFSRVVYSRLFSPWL